MAVAGYNYWLLLLTTSSLLIKCSLGWLLGNTKSLCASFDSAHSAQDVEVNHSLQGKQDCPWHIIHPLWRSETTGGCQDNNTAAPTRREKNCSLPDRHYYYLVSVSFNLTQDRLPLRTHNKARRKRRWHFCVDHEQKVKVSTVYTAGDLIESCEIPSPRSFPARASCYRKKCSIIGWLDSTRLDLVTHHYQPRRYSDIGPSSEQSEQNPWLTHR